MSGQTASSGADAGKLHFVAAGHDFLPIPLFVLGVFLGLLSQSEAPGSHLPLVFGFIFVLLSGVVLAPLSSTPPWLCIMALALAMGMMNTTLSRVGGQSTNVGFVTGDLKSIAGHLVDGLRRKPVPQAEAPWDTHWRRAGSLAAVWSAFITGAFLGGALASRFGSPSLIGPAAMSLFLGGVALLKGR